MPQTRARCPGTQSMRIRIREGTISQRKVKLLFSKLGKQMQHRLKLTDVHLLFAWWVHVITILHEMLKEWKAGLFVQSAMQVRDRAKRWAHIKSPSWIIYIWQ